MLIVGSGLAALRAAIEAQAAGRSVLVASKGICGRSGCSAITSAGFSVALGHADSSDSPDLHYRDTIKGGAGINNHGLARLLCEEAIDRFWELVAWEVKFEKEMGSGRYRQYPSGDHSRDRVAVCVGHRGLGMTLPLKRAASQVRFLDHLMALDLMKDKDGISGIVAIDLKDLKVTGIRSRSTILTTGGVGQLYSVTSNPADVTGDGLAMAYRAGAALIDLEFVQFYPWRLISLGRGRVPIQPSSFARGVILRNAQGERFMEHLDPARKEATTRDIAARGIFTEIVEGRDVDGGVILDLSAIAAEEFARLNPRVARLVEKRRRGLENERLIVSPETHFHMGGVRVDEWGRTSLRHLYAAGEVAGGIHGGNRLDSNALPEGQVFGRRAGGMASLEAEERGHPELDRECLSHWEGRVKKIMRDAEHGLGVSRFRSSIRECMALNASIVRNAEKLTEGISQLRELRERVSAEKVAVGMHLGRRIETQNMALVGELIARAALFRSESRGAHFRSDFPSSDDTHWLGSVVLQRHIAGEPSLAFQSVAGDSDRDWRIE